MASGALYLPVLGPPSASSATREAGLGLGVPVRERGEFKARCAREKGERQFPKAVEQ